MKDAKEDALNAISNLITSEPLERDYISKLAYISYIVDSISESEMDQTLIYLKAKDFVDELIK